MLLIDLLVKRGLWPEGYNFCAIDEDGTVDFYQYKPVIGWDKTSWVDRVSEECDYKGGFVTTWFTGDWSNSVVTLEQYEAALKPVWDGKGVPPVGTECILVANGRDILVPGLKDGDTVKVIAHFVNQNNRTTAAVTYSDDKGNILCTCVIRECLQPIQTERDKFVINILIDTKSLTTEDAEALYNAGYRKV